MNTPWDGRREAGAWVDHSTLRGEVVGSDTLYRVSLGGPIDERWFETCRKALLESPALRRFRLDRGGAAILFNCRTVDGPGLVFEALELLDALLARVNRQVQVTAPPPEVPAADARPRRFA